ADGLRNAVGIAWAEDSLYTTVNGVDHLGDNAPDDVMYKITEGKNYGWPYCYESGSVSYEDTARQWNRQTTSCKDTPLSFASFGPHAAPIGVTYFKNAPALINNTFLVALRGSFKVSIGNGYNITRVAMDGTQEIFMDGFLGKDEERFGRPLAILQNDEKSFFFTDDFLGRLYYVYVK
ncbi:MAG TPA: glucose/sorbosone dehydrogenase, partial [Candidatus Yonathbacteria bacterium]|nr:glucose/sorbosone dehydrogenase [Candidatus Yonathbacteria bacterium]